MLKKPKKSSHKKKNKIKKTPQHKFAGDFVFEGYLKCSHLYTFANTYIFGYTKNFFNS